MTGSESQPFDVGRILPGFAGAAAIAAVTLVLLSTSEVAEAQESEAAAQDQPSVSSSTDRVLHEYVEPSTLRFASEPGGARAPGSEAPSQAKPQQTGTRAGQPPELTLSARQGDTIRGPGGPVEKSRARSPYGPSSPQGGSTQLDDKTDQVDDLQYYSSFNPSVFPYKRNVAQNQVVYRSGRYRMAVREGNMSRQRVEGQERANEDTFWGSFLLRAEAGELHPIPSVAPDQRILEMYAEPDVQLRVYKDAADNWYMRIPHDGLVRVNAKIAAPRFYFDGDFGESVGWDSFSTASGLGLEGRVQAVARQVLDDIGISHDVAPARAMNLLVFHFRNFETRSLESQEKEEDLYRTIATRQVGVCRHRSLAFVITARALGIPARYVFNEAHAFVEVWWPEGGWRRVDLGGAAQDIGYNGSSGDRVHDGGSDSLPRPPKFRRELERQREDADGKDDRSSDGEREQAQSGRQPDGEPSSSGQRRDTDQGRHSDQRDPDGRQQESTSPRQQGDSQPPNPDGSQMAEALMEQRDRAADAASRGRPTRLVLRADRDTVRRGDGVLLYGVLSDDNGQALAGKTVKLYLGRVGERETREMRQLTDVQTNSRGRFRARISIPKGTSIGRWSLVAVFPGDQTYQPSRDR